MGVHSANDASYRPLANKDNDYLIDRDAQRRGETYSGVKGIALQDASLQESMGPVVDRTKERLVATDAGIIKARQKLRKAALALTEEGTEPVGNRPVDQTVRSVAIVLPADQSFIDGLGETMVARPGVPQTTV
jgi:hypothetical protein